LAERGAAASQGKMSLGKGREEVIHKVLRSKSGGEEKTQQKGKEEKIFMGGGGCCKRRKEGLSRSEEHIYGGENAGGPSKRSRAERRKI